MIFEIKNIDKNYFFLSLFALPTESDDEESPIFEGGPSGIGSLSGGFDCEA